MRKQFKPLIKHDVVTQTYTIRDKKGVVIQVPGVIIDELDNYYKEERDTLVDDLSWYEEKVSRLEQIREIKDSALKGADIKIKTLEQENNNLKQSVSDYKDYAEGHVASYLEMRALEHENEQLKEENEKLKTQKIAFQRSYKQAYEENKDLKDKIERL